MTLKKLLVFILIITILFTSFIVFLVESTLRPVLYEISKIKASSLVTEVINKAVYYKSTQLSYDDLMRTKTDRQGNIILMQPDLQKINQMSSQISLEIQNNLKKIENEVVKLPIVKIFGIQVLAKYSPKLDARIVPYASIQTDILDYFQSAGINQTRHKIDLEVVTKVKVIVPFLSNDIRIKNTVPLAEAVIVGRVPEVYVGLEKGLISTKK
jgi:sporulation protein YunB